MSVLLFVLGTTAGGEPEARPTYHGGQVMSMLGWAGIQIEGEVYGGQNNVPPTKCLHPNP